MTKPRVMKSVSAVINGISIIGFSVSKFNVKPKKPLSNDSKIIIWNRKMGKVFALIAFTMRLRVV